MNIYIYGNQGFKKDIHSTLDHANIKFKLNGNSIIKDIDSVEELKSIIQNNPNDIYLIDDEKIIKKNAKIKFLNPKDGIEETFLLDNGIADISVNSFNEIPKYILKKYEEQEAINEDIQNSIIDIVDEAYEKNNVELDDELSMLLAKEDNIIEEDKSEKPQLKDEIDEFDIDINLDDFNFDDELKSDDSLSMDEDFEKLMDFDDNVGLNNVSFDYDDDNLLSEEKQKEESLDNDIDNFEIEDIDDFIENMESANIEELSNDSFENIVDIPAEIEKEDIKEKVEVNFSKGEMMNDEFSELDLLNEKDIMEALSDLDTPVSPSFQSTQQIAKKPVEVVDLNSTNVNQLSELIAKLLQNKTLEITIKIKD